MESSTASILASWVAASCIFSTYANTAFLLAFNDPAALTFNRFFGSCIIGGICHIFPFRSLSIKELIHHIPSLLLPSLALLSANAFNSIALNLTGISVTYITKSTIPIWTFLICKLYFKLPTANNLIYVSLFPTVIGVAMASFSDIDFNINGFMAALASTLAQTILNIISKHSLNKSELTGSQFQFIMVTVNSIILLPYYTLYSDGINILDDTTKNNNTNYYWSLIVFISAPLAYHIEYVLNCMLVGNLSNVTFSMCDIARRLGIIVCGCVMFDKALNAINMIGIILALGGVTMYSYLKSKEIPK